MSLALVNYSSSSDSDNSECESNETNPPDSKRPKLSNSERKPLPLPNAIRNMNKVVHEKPVDNPEEHNGRVRRFEHERGNWTTFVYIAVDNEIIEDLQNSLKTLLSDQVQLKCTDDNHISLTKTVILRHHWIDSFVKSVQEALLPFNEFSIAFDHLKVYSNEDKSRTFLGLAVDRIYFSKLEKIMCKLDCVMEEFRLEKFYEDPSFHTSILWCNGDQHALLTSKLPLLHKILDEFLEKHTTEFRLNVNTFYCKTGNKKFSFPLSG